MGRWCTVTDDAQTEDEARMDACKKHIPTFDEAEASKLLGDWQPKNPKEWILGNPGRHEVRRRWPRFEGTCECGFHGISYASFAHYTMGDW